MIKKIKISGLSNKDYKSLSIFLKEEDQKKRNLDFWKNRLLFWWDQNPFFSNNKLRGYILKSDKKIIGFFGLIIMKFKSHNSKKILETYTYTTWVVNKKFRAYSLNLLNRILDNKKITNHIDGTPTKAVERILNHFNFRNKSLKRSKIFFPNLFTLLKHSSSKNKDIFSKFFLIVAGGIQIFISNLFLDKKNYEDVYEIKNKKFLNLTFSKDFKYSLKLDFIKWFSCNHHFMNKKKIFLFLDSKKNVFGYAFFHTDKRIKNVKNFILLDYWPVDNLTENYVLKCLNLLNNGKSIITFDNLTENLSRNLFYKGIFLKIFKSRNLYLKTKNNIIKNNITQLYSDINF